jgi:hypothetical protein
MSVRPIIDAGPGLNFLSINKERLLIAILGAFSAPETVQGEVVRKSQQDDRFRAAAAVWRRHAVVAAESGQSVTILIDDGIGARIATSEIGRLQRLVSSGHAVGSITLASTLTVLARAACTEHLPLGVSALPAVWRSAPSSSGHAA